MAHFSFFWLVEYDELSSFTGSCNLLLLSNFEIPALVTIIMNHDQCVNDDVFFTEFFNSKGICKFFVKIAGFEKA